MLGVTPGTGWEEEGLAMTPSMMRSWRMRSMISPSCWGVQQVSALLVVVASVVATVFSVVVVVVVVVSTSSSVVPVSPVPDPEPSPEPEPEPS